MRLRFLLRRLAMLVATLLVSSFVIFSALYLAPGNPIATLSGGRTLPPEASRSLEQRYHLNDPFLARYWPGSTARCTATSALDHAPPGRLDADRGADLDDGIARALRLDPDPRAGDRARADRRPAHGAAATPSVLVVTSVSRGDPVVRGGDRADPSVLGEAAAGSRRSVTGRGVRRAGPTPHLARVRPGVSALAIVARVTRTSVREELATRARADGRQPGHPEPADHRAPRAAQRGHPDHDDLRHHGRVADRARRRGRARVRAQRARRLPRRGGRVEGLRRRPGHLADPGRGVRDREHDRRHPLRGARSSGHARGDAPRERRRRRAPPSPRSRGGSRSCATPAWSASPRRS